MQRTVASPRLGLIQPVSNESPSKRQSDGLSSIWGSANPNPNGKHKHTESRSTSILVSFSVLLNVAVIALMLFRGDSSHALHHHHEGENESEHRTAALYSVPPVAITTPSVGDTTLSPPGMEPHELNAMQLQINGLKFDLMNSQNSHSVTSNLLSELKEKHESLKKEYESAQDELKTAKSDAKTAENELEKVKSELAKHENDGGHPHDSDSSVALTSHCASDELARVGKDDLALQGDKFDLSTHEFNWKCDDDLLAPHGNLTFCPDTPTNEQYFQLTFFDRPGAGSKVAVRKGRPVSPSCVQLPPKHYQWPEKHQKFPVPKGKDGVHWPNLRVDKLEDLLVFNKGTPKNLYHFNASFYDYEQEAVVNQVAKFVPFKQKIRVALDIGSGGGSLGIVLKRRYDIQTISTVFADWPYCEYITERGNLCMYVDAMEAMPFAKFSYDMIHSSWVFHALFNHQLVTTFLEQNRILRPGGYLWINGGWSQSQVETIENLFLTQLGYQVIYSHKKNVASPGKTKFDTVPFELEWQAILVKPIRADENTCRKAAEKHNSKEFLANLKSKEKSRGRSSPDKRV